MARTSDDHWKKDPFSGELVAPPLIEEYVDWMYTPARTPSTQKEWAREHDLHPDTVKRWKRDPRFKDYQQARAAAINLDPMRVQDVLEAIYAAAKGGDVQAAREYLRWAEKFLPPPPKPTPPPSPSDLSEEELLAEIQAGLAEVAEAPDPFDG